MQAGQGVQAISIHALREEGDGLMFCLFLHRYISIHALREEGDLWRYPQAGS